MNTRLLLVRHGESTWNAERRWQGRADPPLSAEGERQARAAARALGVSADIDAVVTSSLQRAVRTGVVLADVLGLRVVERMHELAERAAGEWEGLTRPEIHERYPGFLDDGRRPPGYEDDRDVVRRASGAVASLAASRPGERLLVVTHGGVINALERRAGEPWLRLDNLEGRWFEVRAGGESPVRPTGERIHLLDADGSDAEFDRSYA